LVKANAATAYHLAMDGVGDLLRPPSIAFVAAGIAVVLSWTSLFAEAGHVPVMDPRDSDGRLDVRRTDVLGTDRPRWKIATYGSWSARGIWDKGFVLVRLDTFGDDRFDFYALVRSTGRAMRGDLYRDRRRKKDVWVSRVYVWRKNRTSVSVRIPVARLATGTDRVHYAWVVQTLFTGPGCRRTCFDLAPDNGAVFEPLPGAPSPTATPTMFPDSRP
jgi:hypothetical protein